MHVLRLTPHFYWPQLEPTGWPVNFDAIGGMQTQIYEQTLALAQTGIRQTILTLRIPGAPMTWEIDARTRVVGVRVPVLPLRSRIRGMVDLNISWIIGVVRYLIRNDVTFDLVHVHFSGVAVPPISAWLMKTWLRIPLVITIHCSSLATYHPMSRLDVLQHRFARWWERAAISAADQVLVLTPRLMEVLRALEPRICDRTAVVPDAIDSDAFLSRAGPEAVAEFKLRFRLPPDRQVIGYVGRIAREKGWTALLDVAERLKEAPVHFLVCGDGNERDVMEAQIRRRGLADRFTLTGYLSHSTVPAAIGACDVLVLVSRHEEFGSVLLEGMAVGIPVIAYNVGGIPFVLNNGDAGILVPDGDIIAMAAGIRTLLSSPTMQMALSTAAKLHVTRKFERKAATEQVASIYQRLTGREPSDD
jgi:2-deoxystreptamine N-acetyl-D-glucosaminyltransferase/2-deoxystreptamine glucosyltransferase